jgi:hypothetical protein
MTEISANTLIALVGLIVALIVNALAIFRYVAGTRDTRSTPSRAKPAC